MAVDNVAALRARVAELQAALAESAKKGRSKAPSEALAGASPLHLAIGLDPGPIHMREDEKSEAEARWAEALARSDGVDARDARGETPLHWAAAGHASDAVKWLAERGADVDASSDFGSPLHYSAVAEGGRRLWLFLLRAGADSEAKGKPKKTPSALLGPADRKMFLREAETTLIARRAKAIAEGARPSLDEGAMRRAIAGAMERYDCDWSHDFRPTNYLQAIGVPRVMGSPTCDKCPASFSTDMAYAKHMLSLDHVLKSHRTTEADMREARAFLDSREAFRDVFHKKIKLDSLLEGYPGEDAP